MHDLALFVTLDNAEAADELMTEVYGEPQENSFRVPLSANGQTQTHLGAFARGLQPEQKAVIAAQSTVIWQEAPWLDSLAAGGLTLLLET